MANGAMDVAYELEHGIIVDGTPSAVGWDAACEVNTTLNAAGESLLNTGREGFGQPDPLSPKRRVRDDPEVEQLRVHLKENNGITMLEICEPHELDRIRTIYCRDGFVVVKDLLTQEQLDGFREGCSRVLAELLRAEGQPEGHEYCTESGRLAHRYSYGTCSASRQQLHEEAWCNMIDVPTTTPILKHLFGTDDYAVGGAGGDLSLPGAIEYQHLHRDGPTNAHGAGPASVGQIKKAEKMGIVPEGSAAKAEDGQLDAVMHRKISEMVHGGCGFNFIVEDLTWENGPIRQIRGTHLNVQDPPSPADEPEWMKMSTLVGAPAGSAVIRNGMCWHGATPNLSDEVRILPSVEYGGFPGTPKTMPYEQWEKLSDHAKHICRYVKCEPGVWPPGAGVNHPLADVRFDAFVAGGGWGNRDPALMDKARAAYARGPTGSIWGVLPPLLDEKPRL